jgi:hypothetical protein
MLDNSDRNINLTVPNLMSNDVIINTFVRLLAMKNKY